ncbi:MAG: hypothetical protein IKR89_13920, partial [Bacteroidaceae bacterium]|nr:hypothetical protein [Bacteroidaceae bacterium]
MNITTPIFKSFSQKCLTILWMEHSLKDNSEFTIIGLPPHIAHIYTTYSLHIAYIYLAYIFNIPSIFLECSYLLPTFFLPSSYLLPTFFLPS